MRHAVTAGHRNTCRDNSGFMYPAKAQALADVTRAGTVNLGHLLGALSIASYLETSLSYRLLVLLLAKDVSRALMRIVSR